MLQIYASGVFIPPTSANVVWSIQTMKHIKSECPSTMLSDGDLQRLHLGDDDDDARNQTNDKESIRKTAR